MYPKVGSSNSILVQLEKFLFLFRRSRFNSVLSMSWTTLTLSAPTLKLAYLRRLKHVKNNMNFTVMLC